MGYVTKTVVETVNDISSSTSLHFESFEDFLKYESRFEEVQQEVKQDFKIDLVAFNKEQTCAVLKVRKCVNKLNFQQSLKT